MGVCSDAHGNVFIADGSAVLEYVHGGTSPIATFQLPGTDAHACSVDPATENLAVVFESKYYDVAVFASAQGQPSTYSSGIESNFCGYDSSGNLFVDGYNDAKPGLSELKSGANSFQTLSISPSVGGPGQVQWDGEHLTYESDAHLEPIISQLIISGTAGTVVGTSHFNVRRYLMPSWIFGSHVVIPYVVRGSHVAHIAVWRYPEGGKPTKTIKDFGEYKHTLNFQGVTLSVGS
jgi:hypothetical protein